MNEPSTVLIRPYRPSDHDSVRCVLAATGYMGDPADWYWADTPSFADVFSRYYTDTEPESLLVAEADGCVVGYLSGCLDSRRPPHLVHTLLPHLILRGVLVRPGTARFMWRSIADIAVDAVHRQLLPAHRIDPRWPAHLHINLLPGVRGCHVGTQLLTQWLDIVAAHEVPGCHLETLAENTTAIAFFESQGFRRIDDPKPAPGLRDHNGNRHHVQLMATSTEPT